MTTTKKSIAIWCNEVYGGWSPEQDFLAGTENFVRQFAGESVKRGFDAIVYQNGFVGDYRGSKYYPHNMFDSEVDILLIVKEASLLDIPLKAKRVIYYTNDIEDSERLTPKRLQQVNKVLALSKYHRDYLLMGIPNVQVLSHGISKKDPPYNKVPYSCLYASSPDRGLQLLLSLWPKIKKEIPEAELEIAYNGKTEPEMEELYSKSEYWLYPCKGVELYCITGIRAQAHGCVPIVTPHMALKETVRHGIKPKIENFVEETVALMKNRSLTESIRNKCLKDTYPTIESEWEQIMI